jgi:hypothetical protein
MNKKENISRPESGLKIIKIDNRMTASPLRENFLMWFMVEGLFP